MASISPLVHCSRFGLRLTGHSAAEGIALGAIRQWLLCGFSVRITMRSRQQLRGKKSDNASSVLALRPGSPPKPDGPERAKPVSRGACPLAARLPAFHPPARDYTGSRGAIVRTFDADSVVLAGRIHAVLDAHPVISGRFLRINRSGWVRRRSDRRGHEAVTALNKPLRRTPQKARRR